MTEKITNTIGPFDTNCPTCMETTVKGEIIWHPKNDWCNFHCPCRLGFDCVYEPEDKPKYDEAIEANL
jgi:hypothetical protein